MPKKLIWVVLVILIGGFLYQKHKNDPVWIQSLFGQVKKGLEWTDCWFNYRFDRPTRCAFLYVPESFDDPDSRTIRLPVVIFESIDAERKDDPVLYLQGGPGPAYIEAQDISWLYKNYIKEGWLKSRDVIVTDYRGLGFSKPAIECNSYFKQIVEVNSPADFLGVYKKCHKKLTRKNIELSNYHALNIVSDLIYLREQLSISKWNLWGQSYGSLIALLLAQQEQQAVRSVIVEGVAPPRYMAITNSYVKYFADLIESMLTPNDINRLEKLILDLREHPKTFEIEVLDESYEIFFDDIALINLIFSELYEAQPKEFIPKLVGNLNTNNHEAVINLIRENIYSFLPQWFSMAGLVTYFCNDGGFFDYEGLQSENLPTWMTSWVNYPDVCTIWLTENHVPALENKKASFDNPVLFLSGKNDPTTPYQWAKNILPEFQNGQMYLFPKLSHNFSGSRCARDFKEDFLEQPLVKVESDCLYPVYFDSRSDIHAD